MTNLCGELVLFPPKEINNPLNRSLELLPTKGFLWLVYSNSRESKYFERNMLRVTFCPPYPPGFDFTGNNTKRRESTSGWSHTQPWQEKKNLTWFLPSSSNTETKWLEILFSSGKIN